MLLERYRFEGKVRKVGTLTIVNEEVYIDEFEKGRYMIKAEGNSQQGIVYSPFNTRLLYNLAEQYGHEFTEADVELHLKTYFTIICFTVSRETAVVLAKKLTALFKAEKALYNFLPPLTLRRGVL